MEDIYVVKKEDQRFLYRKAAFIQKPSDITAIEHPTKVNILTLVAKTPLFISEIAEKLKIHEQNVYYHIKPLIDAGILETIEKKEKRGTVAKKYAARSLTFALTFGGDWLPVGNLFTKEQETPLLRFLAPFIHERELNAKIVVGSPDPHGEFKARARDGHYAIELSLFLGQLVQTPKQFSVMLDVDCKLEQINEHLILVGGPVTNLLVSAVNTSLPVRFSAGKPWELISEKTGKHYTDDAIGFIARVPNPHFSDKMLLLLAGIRYSGTKAAVLAFTRFHNQILSRYSDQKLFASVVQGFDLDGDGKIDSIEVLE